MDIWNILAWQILREIRRKSRWLSISWHSISD